MRIKEVITKLLIAKRLLLVSTKGNVKRPVWGNDYQC